MWSTLSCRLVKICHAFNVKYIHGVTSVRVGDVAAVVEVTGYIVCTVEL